MSNDNAVRVPSNVKDNADDAKVGAQKRIRGLDNQLRKIRNTASWKLSDAERVSMADFIMDQTKLTVDTLLGVTKSDVSQFTF